MAFSFNDPEADQLARELAATTGESLTDAVLTALRERLERERGNRRPSIGARLRRLAGEARNLPILDPRDPDELLGYDQHGLPT